MHPRAHAILDCWFSEQVIANQLWFKADADFDRTLLERFGVDHAKALAGQYDDWLNEAESALALVLALDQFPRNMYRNTPRAFESDLKAQDIASTVVARGLDQQVAAERRVFFYMPFEHAEDMALQKRSVELISALGVKDYDHYAQRHAEIIAQFGRFPHRNTILGRVSTPAEMKYLAETPHEFG